MWVPGYAAVYTEPHQRFLAPRQATTVPDRADALFYLLFEHGAALPERRWHWFLRRARAQAGLSPDPKREPGAPAPTAAPLTSEANVTTPEVALRELTTLKARQLPEEKLLEAHAVVAAVVAAQATRHRDA